MNNLFTWHQITKLLVQIMLLEAESSQAVYEDTGNNCPFFCFLLSCGSCMSCINHNAFWLANTSCRMQEIRWHHRDWGAVQATKCHHSLPKLSHGEWMDKHVHLEQVHVAAKRWPGKEVEAIVRPRGSQTEITGWYSGAAYCLPACAALLSYPFHLGGLVGPVAL